MGYRSIQRILLVCSVGLASAIGHAQSSKKDMFWEPDIDQPIRQLEEILAELKQQQPMNYTIANISFLYDAKLYIIFSQYLEKLPKTKRDPAIKEQNQWLVERSRAMGKEQVEYEGGTMAPYAVGLVKVDFTKARIKVIEDQLKRLSRDS